MKEIRAIIRFKNTKEIRYASLESAYVNIDFDLFIKGKKEKSYSLDVDRRFKYIPFGKYNLLNFMKDFIVSDDIDCQKDIEIVVTKVELVFPNETYSLENEILSYYTTKFLERKGVNARDYI